MKSGYRLPFLQYPAPVCMKNHRSALENKEFVHSAIDELLAASCVVECNECPNKANNPPEYPHGDSQISGQK